MFRPLRPTPSSRQGGELWNKKQIRFSAYVRLKFPVFGHDERKGTQEAGMEILRYVNEKKIQGKLPPLVIKNQGVLAIYQNLRVPLAVSKQSPRKKV